MFASQNPLVMSFKQSEAEVNCLCKYNVYLLLRAQPCLALYNLELSSNVCVIIMFVCCSESNHVVHWTIHSRHIICDCWQVSSNCSVLHSYRYLWSISLILDGMLVKFIRCLRTCSSTQSGSTSGGVSTRVCFLFPPHLLLTTL